MLTGHRMKPRILLPIIGAIVFLIAVACGSSATATPRPTVAPAATTAPAVTTAPAPTTAPQATTAGPQATIRPTNTPRPTSTPITARATSTPASGPKAGGRVNMSAYADTKDWDPKGSSSLSRSCC